MRRYALCPAAVVLGMALLAPPGALASADDSRLGDETAVNEAGECEVEVGLERSRRRPEPTERTRAVELACGVGRGFELGAAWARQRAGGEREDELRLEAKAELVGAEPGRPGWSVGLGLAGTREAGRRWRRSAVEAVGETTLLLTERWLAELTLGVARDVIERRHRTLWSAAIEHALPGDAFELRVEVGGDDRSRPLVAFGLRWLFHEDAHLKVEYGRRNGSERERILLVGVKFEFDLGSGP